MSATDIAVVNHPRAKGPIDLALLYGTFGLVLFGPLAFGAVEPWSIFVIEAGATALFLVWIAKQVLSDQFRLHMNPIFFPMGAFGLLIVVQLVFQRSAYRHDSVSQAWLFCAYAMLCFLVSQTLLRDSQARKLAWIFCIYGAAVAVFALVQSISSNGKLYWIRQPRLGGWIYGPYVNHNHYAGLMEMLIPIPLVLSLTQLAPSRERLVAAGAAAVMAGTVFLSGSRGGMLALLVELIVLAVVLVKQQRGWQTALALGVFLLVAVSLLAWLGGAELARRVATVETAHSDVNEAMRLQIDRDALHMFLRRPVLGWGLGAFPVVYPEFRSFYTNFFVNEAHNDYLQLLVEMGLLGFATMVWMVVVVYRAALKKISNWTSDVSGAVSLASVIGLTGILVHSAIDFNLQIPGNAALFYVLCTISAARPFVKPMRKRRFVPATPAEDVLPASEVV